jgi:hypothetical protein
MALGTGLWNLTDGFRTVLPKIPHAFLPLPPAMSQYFLGDFDSEGMRGVSVAIPLARTASYYRSITFLPAPMRRTSQEHLPIAFMKAVSYSWLSLSRRALSPAASRGDLGLSDSKCFGK